MIDWIDVNEKTPHFFEPVIITDGIAVGVAMHHFPKGWLQAGTLERLECHVTHWQLLPQPPQRMPEEEEEELEAQTASNGLLGWLRSFWEDEEEKKETIC